MVFLPVIKIGDLTKRRSEGLLEGVDENFFLGIPSVSELEIGFVREEMG